MIVCLSNWVYVCSDACAKHEFTQPIPSDTNNKHVLFDKHAYTLMPYPSEALVHVYLFVSVCMYIENMWCNGFWLGTPC